MVEGEFVTVQGERGRLMPLRLTLPRTRAELAYVAGIIDGEGCITRWSKTRSWGVQVGMTHRGVIEWLSAMGGTFTVRPGAERKKESYIWRVLSQRDVVALLTALLPYLRVKRERAEECLADLRGRK